MTMAANATATNLNILVNVATPNKLHDDPRGMYFTQATISYITVEQGMKSLEEFQIVTSVAKAVSTTTSS